MLRLALGFESQAAWCRATGFTTGEWNHFEKGRRKIGIEQAQRIKQLFGVPLDFIYDGDIAAMPHALASKLQSA